MLRETLSVSRTASQERVGDDARERTPEIIGMRGGLGTGVWTYLTVLDRRRGSNADLRDARQGLKTAFAALAE